MSALDFDLFIVIMFWSALGIFVVVLGLMVLLLFARLGAIMRRRRIAALVVSWRGIFAGTSTKPRSRVRRKDAFTVLSLWNDFHRVRADDDAKTAEDLIGIARAYYLDTAALELLRHGDTGDRIVALTFIGNIRMGRALPLLLGLTSLPDGDISLMAFRAGALIDEQEIEPFVRAVANRADWRPRTIERILKELGPKRISDPMAAVAEDSSDDEATRLMRYFPLCEPATARALIREQLVSRSAPNLLAMSLKALTHFVKPIDHDLIIPMLRHPVSFVRVNAIEAIAPICTMDDRNIFLELVTDANSWVRYRAAEVLVAYFTDTRQVGSLRKEITDRYAQDALSQVLAERSLVPLLSPEDQPSGLQEEPRHDRRAMTGVMRTGI